MAAELALVLPVLLLLLFAIIQFGITLNNYIELTNGAAAGARQLSISRGSTTPYSSTVTAVDNAAPNLTAANISVTMSVNGTACTANNATCENAFAIGDAAQVTATYPCNMNVLWITFSSCTLSSSASEIVE